MSLFIFVNLVAASLREILSDTDDFFVEKCILVALDGAGTLCFKHAL